MASTFSSSLFRKMDLITFSEKPSDATLSFLAGELAGNDRPKGVKQAKSFEIKIHNNRSDTKCL